MLSSKSHVTTIYFLLVLYCIENTIAVAPLKTIKCEFVPGCKLVEPPHKVRFGMFLWRLLCLLQPHLHNRHDCFPTSSHSLGTLVHLRLVVMYSMTGSGLMSVYHSQMGSAHRIHGTPLAMGSFASFTVYIPQRDHMFHNMAESLYVVL